MLGMCVIWIMQSTLAGAQTTARSEKIAARDDLAKYLNHRHSKLGRAAAKATAYINRSLDSSLWLTENTLTKNGETVFENEKHAAHELEKHHSFCRGKYDFLGSVKHLVAADSILADVAVAAARSACSDSVCQKQIDCAERWIAEAEKLNHEGRYSKAIERYKMAWLSIQDTTSRRLTDVGDDSYDVSSIPVKFNVEQNYPNPFNPSTTIRYSLPEAGHVTLRLYNLLGQEIMTLVDQIQEPGFKSVTFEVSGVASGMYYYRIEANGMVVTKKLIVAK